MGLLDYADEYGKKFRAYLSQMPVVQALRMGAGEQEFPSAQSWKQGLLGVKPFKRDIGMDEASAFWNPAGLLGKIVYHGSPHKFDKFDASKIGTGEGAQAYGHGIYAADSIDVAKQYKNLAPREFLDGPIDWDNPIHVGIRSADLGGGVDGGIARLMRTVQARTAAPKNKEIAREAIEFLRSGESFDKYAKEGGSLYKVDLPDEWIPKMLDWDKPLNQQPENVRLLAKDLGLAKDATGKDVYSALSNQARDMGIIKGQNAQTTLPGSQGRAATDLAEFGIPGIKYLDGGSRPNSGRITMLEQTIANLKNKGASKAAIANTQHELDAELARASYNYVVFPGLEDKVKILERNGIGLLGQ